jgi:hypothetical protein
MADAGMAVMRALSDVSLVLDLLSARNFDFFVLNVVIELLLALQLRLMWRIGSRVVLLT